jgi:hypothetical protein
VFVEEGGGSVDCGGMVIEGLNRFGVVKSDDSFEGCCWNGMMEGGNRELELRF